MNLTIIAAMSKNRAIGRDNDLIWKLPKDLKRFKELTSGHHIIMGRKTFESIGRPLPNRTNIIVTSQTDYKAPGCIIVHTIEEAINKASRDEQPFIVGGANVYKQSFRYAKTLELTLVDETFEDADAFFPKFDENQWKEVSRIRENADDKNLHNMDFIRYEKQYG